MKHPSFDDIGEEEENGQSGYRPFQFREDTTEEGTLEWLNNNFDHLYMDSRDRLMTYRRLAARFKNSHENNGWIRDSHRDHAEGNKKPTVRTNFYCSYVDQKVSSVSKTKQNPSFIPLNDEQDDLNNVEACSLLVKFRMKELNIDALMRNQDAHTFKYGHSFAKVFWDKCAGPVREDFEKLTKKHGPIKMEDGETATEYNARLGDVMIEIIDPDLVFPERRRYKWEKVNFLDQVEFVDIDEVRAEHPDAEIVKEDYQWLDIDGKGYNEEETIAVHHFYHRPTKWLEHGIYIKWIEGSILEMKVTKEEVRKIMPDGELPFVPDIDIELDKQFWGMPFLINIEQLNNMYDLIQSGMARNFGVSSHPKLLVAENSINLKQANNEHGVMQWRGTHKPEWLQHQWVNRGEFEVQDRLEKKMDLMSKVYDISKGVIPAGITATSALRLLDDQELQANSQTVSKRRERIKKVYWKTLKMMEVNYAPGDKRMARILGENNEYLIKGFAKYDFGKIFGVDIENNSALADTRSGRVSDIIDLNAANQKDPTFTRKEIIQLLELGNEKAFMDEIAYATITARTLLESIKRGETVPAPAMTDDLFEMYAIFSRFVESVTYKLKIKDQTRKAIKDHIFALEYLMAEKSKMNARFAGRVREFDKFPMFYTPGAEITALAPAPAGAPGAPTGGQPKANGGLENISKKNQEEMNKGEMNV